MWGVIQPRESPQTTFSWVLDQHAQTDSRGTSRPEPWAGKGGRAGLLLRERGGGGVGSDPRGPGASERREALSTAAGGACVGTAEGEAGPTGDLSRCPLSQAPSPLTAEPPACLGPGVLPWLPRVVGVFLSQKHKAA